MAAGDARRALSGLFSYDLLDHFYSFLLFRTYALLWLKFLLCLLSLVYFRDAVSTSPPPMHGVCPSYVHSVT